MALPNGYKLRTPYPIEHGVRTGFVFVRDFDLGMAKSIIGVQEDVNPPNDMDRFYLEFSQLPPDERRATIIFKTPEPTLQWHKFPRVMISRDSVVTALERWNPITQEYMVPAAGAATLSIPAPLPQDPPLTGPDRREAKEQAWPHDLTYTIECWHRYPNWAMAMVFRVMKSFPPYGMMKLRDSLDEERSYDAFGGTELRDLTEALSMTDRGSGFAWTVRVTGELDLGDPVTLTTVRTVNPTLHRINPLSGPFD